MMKTENRKTENGRCGTPHGGPRTCAAQIGGPRAWAAGLLLLTAAAAVPGLADERPNIVFILIDDQRFDAASALGHPFLETPHLDRLIERGVLFENAFVTTSLCSPSRASILTGQYAHLHGVLDNRTRLDPRTPTFPQELQRAGYRTAFIGKWHMGGTSDAPRPGFDRWVSFPGQGLYYNQTFNVDGERVPRQGYTTDLITDYALEFLEARDGAVEPEEPFLLYVSHKAVHSPFRPAERHLGSYGDRRYPAPDSMANRHDNYEGKPNWVEAQRRSWHGVDGLYDNRVDFWQFALDYAETMRAVDDSVGRIVGALEEQGLLERTLLVYTSDNGFQFGEHGLIDKRTMYETSIRVPLIVLAPGFKGGSGGLRRPELIVNLDFAPTFLEAAGIEVPSTVQGRSFLGLIDADRADGQPWRDAFLYEYFWERAFPQTPTVLGVRTDRYKLMRFHGVWDRYELYDLEADPDERRNLLGDFITRHGAGNVETRLAVAARDARSQGGEKAGEVLELKALFDRLSGRLDELLDEAGALREPGWRVPPRP